MREESAPRLVHGWYASALLLESWYASALLLESWYASALLLESTQLLEICNPGSNEAEVTHGSDALAVYHKQLLKCCNPERRYLGWRPCPSSFCRLQNASIYATLASSTVFCALLL